MVGGVSLEDMVESNMILLFVVSLACKDMEVVMLCFWVLLLVVSISSSNTCAYCIVGTIVAGCRQWWLANKTVPKNYEQLLTLALFVRVLLGIRIYKAMKHGNDKFISAEKSEILYGRKLEFMHFRIPTLFCVLSKNACMSHAGFKFIGLCVVQAGLPALSRSCHRCC